MLSSEAGEKTYFLKIMRNKSSRVKYELLMEYAMLIRRPCFFWNEYFPIVMNGKNIYNKGTDEKIEIGIGTYFTYADGETTELYVNGEKQLIEDGKVIYSLSTGNLGEKEVLIEAVYTNPLTGELQKSESVYVYEVND